MEICQLTITTESITIILSSVSLLLAISMWIVALNKDKTKENDKKLSDLKDGLEQGINKKLNKVEFDNFRENLRKEFDKVEGDNKRAHAEIKETMTFNKVENNHQMKEMKEDSIRGFDQINCNINQLRTDISEKLTLILELSKNK